MHKFKWHEDDNPLHRTGEEATASAHKWLMRKRNGEWWVWKPFETEPVTSFLRFPYLWNQLPSFAKGRRALTPAQTYLNDPEIQQYVEAGRRTLGSGCVRRLDRRG